MKKITSFLLVALIALAMTSCAKWQAQPQLNALESLVEKVEQKGADFTTTDWNRTSEKYDAICTKMSQYEYTNEQLQEIGKLKARYYIACAKGVMGGGILNGLFQQATGAFDGVMDEVGNALDEAGDALDEASGDLDEALEELDALFDD